MHHGFLRLFAGTAAVASFFGYSTWSESESEAVSHEYLVQTTKPAFSVSGFHTIEKIRPDLYLVRDEEGGARPTALARLMEDSGTVKAEPNFLYRANVLPDDPQLSVLWGLKNTGAMDTAGQAGVGGVDIGAEAAWNISTGSRSVVVAVIDTGIDFTHPDLAPQAWVNEPEKNGIAGVDDDGNGLVDDIHGYNFVGNSGDASDDNNHGSHCAGTIGAKGNDGRGLVGINWDVRLMALKFLDKNGSGSLANAIKAIDYARAMKANVMSNSWGGGSYSALLETSIAEANRAGILFVAAAGNEHGDNDVRPSYPANYSVENVVSVAAIDNRGQLASFSNFGSSAVHVAAPGVNIVSTVPGGGYDSYSGTSMAAPHVSGVAALMLAKNPTLTPVQIRDALIKQSRPTFLLKSRVRSAGVVDAYYALSGKQPPLDPNDPTRLPKVAPYRLATDHPYKENTKLTETIHIPGAVKMAIRFSQFETETGYDAVSFYSPSGVYLGSMSGKPQGEIVSPMIFGDTVVLKFASDESIQLSGFEIDGVLYE